MNQKGGVFLERMRSDGKTLSETHDPYTLTWFLRNSTLTPIALGASGFIIKARLHDELPTPYVEFGFNVSGKIQMDRRELLIKLCILSDIETDINIIIKNLRTITDTDFATENALQSEIYRRTNVCLDSIVPYIFHSAVFDKNSELYSIFNMNPFTRDQLFQHLEGVRNIKIGLIAMATTLDDVNLNSFVELQYSPKLLRDMNTNSNRMKCIGIESMIRLSILARCKHGDWHYGNLLYSNKMSPYLPVEERYEWFKESCCIIIDFGRGKELTSDEYSTNWTLFKQFLETNRGNRRECLIALMTSIYNQGSSFKRDLDEYIHQGMVGWDFYGWIKHIDESIAETVFNLILARIHKKQLLREQIERMISEVKSWSVKIYSPKNKKIIIKILTESLNLDKIEEYFDEKKAYVEKQQQQISQQALLEQEKQQQQISQQALLEKDQHQMMAQQALLEPEQQQMMMPQQYGYSTGDIVMFNFGSIMIYGTITKIDVGETGNLYTLNSIYNVEYISIHDSQIVPGTRISPMTLDVYMALLREVLLPNINTILNMQNCTIHDIDSFIGIIDNAMQHIEQTGDYELSFIYNWLKHITILINELPRTNICERAKNDILNHIHTYITENHAFVQINYLRKQNANGAFRTSGGKRIRKKTMKRHRKKQTKRKKQQRRTRNKHNT